MKDGSNDGDIVWVAIAFSYMSILSTSVCMLVIPICVQDNLAFSSVSHNIIFSDLPDVSKY